MSDNSKNSYYSACNSDSFCSMDSLDSLTPSLHDKILSQLGTFRNYFNCCHITAQSLPRHFSEFSTNFSDNIFHAILISERWLKPNLASTLYSLPGYVLIRCDRTGKGGGGVAIYLQSNISYKIIAISNSKNMNQDLKNKVVVITGGAVGIGHEIAERFLQKGVKLIIILDIDERQGTEAVKNLCKKHGTSKAVFMKCDVTADLEVISKKIIDAYKTVDVLINNAGILNDQLQKKTIDINVQAVIDWSMKFWEHMRTDKSGKGGTIINLSSIYGYRVDQYLPIYQASKFAVMGFTKSLGHAYNCQRSGVRVVAICPGFTETKLTADPRTWDDKCLVADFTTFLKKQLWQKVDAVGTAVVDVFEKAKSGTAWLIEGSKPIVEV